MASNSREVQMPFGPQSISDIEHQINSMHYFRVSLTVGLSLGFLL